MTAYVITTIQVTDPAGFEEYKKQAGSAVQNYGGKFLARGGALEVLEGNWDFERVVIIQFESVQRAKDWCHSEAYQQAKEIRAKVSQTNMIVVEGID